MTFFETIDNEARSSGLPYLVIDGYAVIAHGFPRLTFDFDLAIQQSCRSAWLKQVSSIGYSVYHDGGAFLQLKSEQHRWPLDFMVLNESTFTKLWEAAEERAIEGVRVRVPSLLHLIASKVHALNHTQRHRFLKDFQDVTELVQRNKIDLASPEICEIFNRYGSRELHEKVRRACEKVE